MGVKQTPLGPYCSLRNRKATLLMVPGLLLLLCPHRSFQLELCGTVLAVPYSPVPCGCHPNHILFTSAYFHAVQIKVRLIWPLGCLSHSPLCFGC